MDQIKKALQLLRILDEEGNLSLTNLILLAVVIKVILKEDAIEATDLGSILAAILGYQGKRAIKARERISVSNASTHTYEITLKDYFHRGDMEEAPSEVIEEAKVTIRAVNKLLKQLNIVSKPIVTSGYRNPSYNKKIGGSPRSAHMSGMAIDISDKYDAIKAQITEEMLASAGLYMEHPDHSKGWIHLQIRPTSRRIFYP